MYRQPKQYYDWSKVPLILDTIQAGLLLQITPESISRMCRKGTIPATQIGSQWRISREVIREMLKDSQTVVERYD